MGSPPAGSVRIHRALLSVSASTGLVALGRGLAERGVELVATEGTRKLLEREGVAARPAEALTGIGSWFGGRIKTLHPGLLGGILAPLTPEGDRELEARGLLRIDLVAVNFYPFAEHLGDPLAGGRREEFVDIGGVTLARAAAKNHGAVAVLTDPAEYRDVLTELAHSDGSLSAATRRRLAVAAFSRCAEYDRQIADGLTEPSEPAPAAFPESVRFRSDPIVLRYGENPYQASRVYDRIDAGLEPVPLRRLKGEALSFTNLLDLDTAVGIVSEFPEPSAAVVKHATPCGVASGASIEEALERAVQTDPVARYGCVIAVNRPASPAFAAPLHGIFVDLLGAPGVPTEALAAVAQRSKLKVVEFGALPTVTSGWEAHSALGRLLLQEANRRQLAPTDFRWVTSRKATDAEAEAMEFAWRVVRHAKSNAVVLAQGTTAVGIGSGQPTRVKAVELATEVAGARARGAVLASDAFFPFADGVEVAARAGVAAIIQPGGSIRDTEVIQAAEKAEMAMCFTGWRVFRH